MHGMSSVVLLYMVAVWSNSNLVITEALLKGGENVNAQNDYGGTPLHSAINNENPDMFVEALFKARANAKIKNNNRKTAFDLAKDNPSLKDSKAYWMLHDAQY